MSHEQLQLIIVTHCAARFEGIADVTLHDDTYAAADC